jgi:hypothetical protein
MSVRADAAATTRAAVLSLLLEEEAITECFHILSTHRLGDFIFACVALTCETRFMRIARGPVVVSFAVNSCCANAA